MMFNKSRTGWLILGLIIAMILVIGMSCAPAPAPTPAPTPTPTPTPTPAPTPTPEFKQIRLKSGSSGVGSTMFVWGEAFARTVTKYADGIILANVETGASYDNHRRLLRGELEFLALGSDIPHYEIYNAIGVFEGDTPFQDLRTLLVFVMNPEPMMVRADLPIYKIEDLEGYEYGPGAAGSSTWTQQHRIFETLGINVIDYPGTYTELVAAVKDRRIAGWTKSMIGPYLLDGSHLDVKSFMDIRMLGLTEEQMKKCRANYPQVAFSYIEVGQIKQMPEAGGFWQETATCFSSTTTKLSQEVVYRIMKAVFEHTDEICAAFPAFEYFTDPADGLKRYVDMGEGYAQLHAGAVQFYKEKGLDVPERAIPPEYKAP